MSNGTSNVKSNIDNKLAELQKNLETAQVTIGKQTILLDSLKTEITELAKTNSEVKKIMDAYENAFDTINKDYEDLKCYFQQKEKALGQQLGLTKNDVDNKFDAFYVLKKAKKDERDEKDNEYKAAQNEYDGCINSDNLNTKQKSYDFQMNYPKYIDDNLKNFKNLKNIVEKELQKGNLDNAYFWVKEFDKENKEKFEKGLQDKVNFSTDLMRFWNGLDNAKKECRSKDENKKTTKIDLDKAQQEFDDLDSLIKSRSDDIIGKIDEIILNSSRASGSGESDLVKTEKTGVRRETVGGTGGGSPVTKDNEGDSPGVKTL